MAVSRSAVAWSTEGTAQRETATMKAVLLQAHKRAQDEGAAGSSMIDYLDRLVASVELRPERFTDAKSDALGIALSKDCAQAIAQLPADFRKPLRALFDATAPALVDARRIELLAASVSQIKEQEHRDPKVP